MRIPISALHRWHPSQPHKTGYLPGEGVMPHLRETYHGTRIQPGHIIVFGERRAFEVIQVSERPLDLWPEHFVNEWQRFTQYWAEQVLAGRDMGRQPERATWEHRPLVLVVRPADQPTAKPQHYAVRASRPFFVLPEHYSVCRLCNEIPPCRHVTTELAVEHEMEKAERLMAIPRGACLGCGEPITSRMKAVRFPGPNLWRPDWPTDSAVFHARQREDCSNAVWRYEQQWKAQGLDDLNATLPEAAP